jgi:hypothetical protein
MQMRAARRPRRRGGDVLEASNVSLTHDLRRIGLTTVPPTAIDGIAAMMCA